jgi:hypothetical protein
MSKSKETFNKREKEKKRLQHRQEKLEKMQERKNHEKKNASLDDMIAYVDENGNLTSTPPEYLFKKERRNEEQSNKNVK